MKIKFLTFLGLALAGIGALSLLNSSPAYAAGESYKWINETTIEASGGLYGQVRSGNNPVSNVQFKRVSGGTYTASVNFVPDSNSSCKLELRLEVGTDFIGANFIATSPQSGPICEDAASGFDKRIIISNTQNGPPLDGSDINYATVTKEQCASIYEGGNNAIRCDAVRICVQTAKKPAADCLRSWHTCLVNRTVNGSVPPDKITECSNLVSQGNLVEAGKGQGAQTPSTTNCVIPKIGWLLCPNMEALAAITDAIYAFLSAFLVVTPITSEPNIQKAWEIMRNFANVAFIIAFLIIIFSQITNVGLSNYGLKRLLPRLIAAAILVNASFWICAIAVDLSNIGGASLRGLFESMGEGLALPDPGGAATAGSAFQKITVQLLTGAVLAGAAMYAGLSILLPILIVCFFTVASVVIGLILRQAAIILLIVVSPLAFVAFLLPNTEGLFEKWRKMFVALLILYPTISLLFGAGSLASAVLMAAAGGN